jgi:hypothetical protein
MPHALLLSALLILSPAIAGNSQTAAERERLIAYLMTSRELLEEATRGLSAEQLRYKPAPDRWSVAECLEHLARAEQTILGVVKRALAAPAVPPAASATVRERDQMILRLASDRTEKFRAPEPLEPSGTPPDESMRTFRARREATLEFVRRSQEDLRGHAADHPLFKNADAYQWLLLAAAHVERHVQQIREVQAAPGFPGGDR